MIVDVHFVVQAAKLSSFLQFIFEEWLSDFSTPAFFPAP